MLSSFIEAGIPAVEFGPAGAGTTARRSGFRCPRWPAIGALWRTSSAAPDVARAPRARRATPARGSGRAALKAIEGGLAAKLIPQLAAGALVRFALGALIVIVFTAATTAVAGLLQFKQLAPTSRRRRR